MNRRHRALEPQSTITRVSLDEDFALGEGIKADLASGANKELMFGRFESALAAFNQTVADTLASSD
ncbi:MAG: hypothetical protein HRT64_02040 [Erythrobacter sp.]|nr:hypothetical protein [Erythrobacter sp.]